MNPTEIWEEEFCAGKEGTHLQGKEHEERAITATEVNPGPNPMTQPYLRLQTACHAKGLFQTSRAAGNRVMLETRVVES